MKKIYNVSMRSRTGAESRLILESNENRGFYVCNANVVGDKEYVINNLKKLISVLQKRGEP